MTHYKYVIVGGGMAANAAVKGIRSVDRDGSIGLISAEPDPPYKRPPLTKDLWKGKQSDIIWYDTADQGAELHLGRAARNLEPASKRVFDDQGDEYTYERLLLANGGTPKRLPFGDGVNYILVELPSGDTDATGRIWRILASHNAHDGFAVGQGTNYELGEPPK